MDSQWLKQQFERNPDKTKAGLARALNLEPPAVSKILNNTRQIKAPEYNTMRRYFGLPVDGEHAVHAMENTYRLDTLAGNQNLQEDVQGAPADSWVIPAEILNQRTQAPPNKIKIFKVQEQLMEPEYRHGEHVLVDLSDQTPTPPGAFIVSDGFGYMLRFCEFVVNSEPPEIKISASNSAFQTQTLTFDDFDIVGRVIAKLQWL